jgi:hypothetical protein
VERPAHHGFRRQVGLELGADDAGVAVRAADLAPDAAVVRAVALGFGLVDVRHALPRVPSDVFLGVHALDLNQRGVLVLVRLGPASRPSSSINDTAKKERAKATTAAADGMRISWRALTSCTRGWFPGHRASRADRCVPSPSRCCCFCRRGRELGVRRREGDGANTEGRNPSRWRWRYISIPRAPTVDGQDCVSGTCAIRGQDYF